MSDVLFRKITVLDSEVKAPPSGVSIRRAAPDESKLWTKTVSQGFAEHHPVTQSILDVMEGFFPAAQCFIASVDGAVAGGAALSVREGVCGLFGASTLPGFRGRGVQSALLKARLESAASQGSDIAVSIAQPGSVSHRNIERHGFRVAYTRTKLIRAVS